MNTLFVGQNKIYLPVVDSTNSYAMELLRQINLPAGSLIYTFNQQKGRGQRNNTWESEPEQNIALSVILYPNFLHAIHQFNLTMIVAISVADVLSDLLINTSYAHAVKIKWPNDIYVNSEKIAGILIENILQNTIIATSVVGVGININQVNFLNAPNATSIVKLTGKKFDKQQIIEKLMKQLEVNYLALKAGKISSLKTIYLNKLYKINEWALYVCGTQQQFKGKIKGISNTGKLQVQMIDDIIKEFDLKEIRFVNDIVSK